MGKTGTKPWLTSHLHDRLSTYLTSLDRWQSLEKMGTSEVTYRNQEVVPLRPTIQALALNALDTVTSIGSVSLRRVSLSQHVRPLLANGRKSGTYS